MNVAKPVSIPRDGADDPMISAVAARRLIRAGIHSGHTAGMALGRLQGNLAILPKDLALEFSIFCHRNPKPCPVVAMTALGDPKLPDMGLDVDIRTDAPRYNIYRNGMLADQVTDIMDHWQDDFVGFVLGCSFSFEDALLKAGIPLRHHEMDVTCPMFATNLATRPVGPFSGGTVVSMRPMTPSNALKAVEITSRFRAAHGAPVHQGDPAAIGIDDISKPDWGDAVEIRDGEIPVFWACGVTPQLVLQNAKPPLCITHTPGAMLIGDQASDAVSMRWSA
jgi:uncharacterized protein YcsI (UPF0317 family)